VKADIRTALERARTGGRAACVVTDLDGGAQAILFEDDADGDLGLSDDAARAARALLATGDSGVIGQDSQRLFVHSYASPLRVFIFGAVHIAQALAPMAALAGYAVTVIDPRGAFATDQRFPGVALSGDWPDEALQDLKPDARTAIVTLTHDPKLDDPALLEALKSDAFYIGALGSRRTHAARLDRLRAEGADERALGRINGPAGLPIGAKSPAEIAVSVLAQMTEALRVRRDADAAA